MPNPNIDACGIVSRKRPQKWADRAETPFRTGSYGEEYNLQLHQKAHNLADEGSYFVVANPTTGTGVASAAAPTGTPAIGATDTKPFLCFQNTDVPGDPGAKRVYFDYVRFRCTAAGTNGTTINFVTILDAANAPRAPSGGSALIATNCNMDDGSASICKISGGAVTVATTNTGRLMPNIQFRGVIPVVNDVYIVSFGPTEYPVGSLISSGTTVCQQSFGHPPIIIGPGQWCLFYLWLAGQSVASSYEFDCGYWER